MKTGVLLINLGTPDAPESGAVRRYLKQFLSDERVLDINPIGRWLLLNLIILPFRSRRSAKAYRKVWMSEGSPLLVYGQQLTEGVRQHLQELGTPVVLGMRYGNPSVGSAIELLREEGCDRILVLPLFPQYASSSTGSAVEEAYREASRHWNTPHLQLLEPFYDDERFIEAFAAVGRP
ncbi:MAG: ferrochelatase, partial [SAR324 cluster bacterium]|nr:ferrochelatase [SAR324 cluster bacterium]